MHSVFPGLQEDSISEVEAKFNKSDLIYFDEQVSMLERTAHKFKPIVEEVSKRMVRHKDIIDRKYQDKNPFQSEWIIEKSRELKI